MNCKVLIIGAGVIGCSIARELSRFNMNVIVSESSSDCATGASGANSGVVHSGHNNLLGSLKADYCVKGNSVFEDICQELEVPFNRIGKIVIAREEDEIDDLKRLRIQGEKNSVRNIKILSKSDILVLEPNVPAECALYVPSSAITNPYLFTIANAENAFYNGVRFLMENPVTSIKKSGNKYITTSAKGEIKSDSIINCSGIHCDEIARMIGYEEYQVYPCRGEYLVLDKEYGRLINRMIYQIPPKDEDVLGIHLTPTVDGNILVGPTSEYIADKWEVSTTRKMQRILLKEAQEMLPQLPKDSVIRTFSGIRCKILPPDSGKSGDFVISENPDGFFHLIGIESPGLTASPIIAKVVAGKVGIYLDLKRNSKFNPLRKGIKQTSSLSPQERDSLIQKEPSYGEILCRCEYVSKAEVLQAIKNPLEVKTLDGIKKRVRCGMGRCQGSFCTIRLTKILEEEFGIHNPTLKGGGSFLFSGRIRGVDTD